MREREREREREGGVHLLANSDEENPVEVIKSDKICPKMRPINVFLLQNSFQLTILHSPKSKAKIYFLRTIQNITYKIEVFKS